MIVANDHILLVAYRSFNYFTLAIGGKVYQNNSAVPLLKLGRTMMQCCVNRQLRKSAVERYQTGLASFTILMTSEFPLLVKGRASVTTGENRSSI